jgi:hypothetical protein
MDRSCPEHFSGQMGDWRGVYDPSVARQDVILTLGMSFRTPTRSVVTTTIRRLAGTVTAVDGVPNGLPAHPGFTPSTTAPITFTIPSL